MMPARPCVYHITHVDNLPAIIQAGGLWSDTKMLARGGPRVSIGMSTIKERRLKLPVRLVRRIGVRCEAVCNRVLRVLGHSAHRPAVKVIPEWYF